MFKTEITEMFGVKRRSRRSW